MKRFKTSKRVGFDMMMSFEETEQMIKHYIAQELASHILQEYGDRINVTTTEYGREYELELGVGTHLDFIKFGEEYANKRIKEITQTLFKNHDQENQ